jgi:hypothetical protein
MAKHNVSESALLTGKSKRTVQRYTRSGQLSSTKDKNGYPLIDTAELIRVFGELSRHDEVEKSAFGATQTTTDISEIISKAIVEAQQPLLDKISELTEKVTNLTNRLDKPKYTLDELLAKCEQPEEKPSEPSTFQEKETPTTNYLDDIPTFGR